MGRYPHENEQNLIDEVAILEQKIRDLGEQVTVFKAERDEFERQRDEALRDLTITLDGWQRCATCEIEGSTEIEAETTQIGELRRKHQL